MNLDNELLLERLAVVSSSIKKDGRNPMPDDNALIAPFCETVELIFRRGLKRGLAIIGLKECDYWNCLEGFLTSTKVDKGIPASVRSTISIIQQSEKVHNAIGRGRLFIRISLAKGLLATTIEFLLLNRKFLRYWYNETTPFLDQNHTECIIGIVKTLNHIQFNLKLTNCSFLHEDWIIPEIIKLELVPCNRIGLTVCCVSGKCIIADVEQGSIAKEYGVTSGDCFDEMCGLNVSEKLSGQMSAIMKANKGQPINAVIIKGKFKDGRWFFPLQRRFKLTGISKAEESSAKDTIQPTTRSRSTFEVSYVSTVDVGKDGSSRIVQDGIKKALETDATTLTERAIRITLAERDIILVAKDNDKCIGKFSYTETSSCGLGDSNSHIFGFITGDTTCSFANKFICHVFRSHSPIVAQEIITGIGKGFNRTLYCV